MKPPAFPPRNTNKGEVSAESPKRETPRGIKGIDEVSLPGGEIQIYVPDPYRELGNKFDNLQLKPIDLK